MGLRPTHWDENWIEFVRVGSRERGRQRSAYALDKSRPWRSLIWNARF